MVHERLTSVSLRRRALFSQSETSQSGLTMVDTSVQKGMKLVDGVWRYYHPAEGWDDYVLTDQGISDTMATFQAWAAAHPDEMLVLYFSHISGGDSTELASEIAAAGVRVASGCNTSITYADAMTFGALNGGGHVRRTLPTHPLEKKLKKEKLHAGKHSLRRVDLDCMRRYLR